MGPSSKIFKFVYRDTIVGTHMKSFSDKPRHQKRRKTKITPKKARPLTNKERHQLDRDHYELHDGKRFTPPTTTYVTPPSTPITTTPNHSTTSTPSSSMSTVWSPRILGHHQFGHPKSLEETLSFTPTNVREILSYYGHLSEVRENLKDMTLFCP